MKPAHLGMAEAVKILRSRGLGADVTAKAESRLHARYEQMKDARPFHGILSDKSSSERSDHTRLSILGWNAGPKRGKVAYSVVG